MKDKSYPSAVPLNAVEDLLLGVVMHEDYRTFMISFFNGACKGFQLNRTLSYKQNSTKNITLRWNSTDHISHVTFLSSEIGQIPVQSIFLR